MDAVLRKSGWIGIVGAEKGREVAKR